MLSLLLLPPTLIFSCDERGRSICIYPANLRCLYYDVGEQHTPYQALRHLQTVSNEKLNIMSLLKVILVCT